MIKFILVFILFSCASVKNKPNKNEIVDISDLNKRTQVSIDKEASIEYGPTVKIKDLRDSKDSEDSEKKILYSLVLRPSLYKSFGYISYFKSIEENGNRPIVISSYGFSAIVTALYAKYLKPNLVEWKSFDLYQRLKKYDVYSNSWKSEIEDFLIKEFKDDKLSQLKILLIIPKYQNRKIIIDPTEEVYKAILNTLDINQSNSTSLLVSSEKNFEKEFKNFGVEKNMIISNLPKEFILKKPNDFLFTIYNTKLKTENYKKTFYLESINKKIDKIINISDEINQVEQVSNKIFNTFIKHQK